MKLTTGQVSRYTPLYFKFAPPVRHGAADAFKLPSIINGVPVPPKAPAEPHPLCVEVS